MTHTGSCHCGRVAFDVDGEPDSALACNCSMCRRRGSLLWFVPRDALRLRTPGADAASYTFNRHAIVHRFCATCGIHTHGDGVIHIHPFSQSGAGENATLGTFLEDTDVKLSDNELTIGKTELPDGAKTWKEGEDECDGKAAEVVVAQWKDVSDENAKPALLTSGLRDIRFRGDGEGYTIAFVPEGDTDIPKPPTAANLAELGSVDAGAQPGSSTTTVPGGSTTTTAGGGATTTTAPGDATTTTAGG